MPAFYWRYAVRFIITEASECPVDFGNYNYKNSRNVHLSCSANVEDSRSLALRKLLNEFSVFSKNYASRLGFYAPGTGLVANSGSGDHPINQPVTPYYVNEAGKFTVGTGSSRIGGLFIKRDDLPAVEAYLREEFPVATIENNTEILYSCSFD